ncbi:MAG TPA: phospholipase D-like domain-containing protein [Candidatus Cloacimonadota bacterium]|nr:phospholipase D-like domain-containing protein [Candidatus Cloacimonadota bacterium]
MIFKCCDEMFAFASDHIRRNRPDWCKICTYGIYIPWVPSVCKSFFMDLRMYNIPTYIVVGYNGKTETKKRIKQIEEDYENVKINLVDEMHAKCILFSDGTFITGSMNITDSKYNELGTVVKLDQDELLDMIMYIDGIC